LALDQIAGGLPWPVYVAGEPRNPDGDAEVAAAHLQLLGQLPTRTVAAWLRSASIYAFPARYEPFGLSILEAALAGCALVLGDIGSLREVWGDSALYVDPDDHLALGQTLQRLIADPDLRHRYAERARVRAARYDAGRMRAQYQSLYRTVRASERIAVKAAPANTPTNRYRAPADLSQVAP
ncbi:MAG TPA: glycosyltransferase, partial [Xanthomonadaceae bacterium]|nr:glycosyltransferase [Xanthomonadaceae bacterium]